MCFCLSAYVSGGKKGFLGGIFWVFGTICEKTMGDNFFMGKVVYVMVCDYMTFIIFQLLYPKWGAEFGSYSFRVSITSYLILDPKSLINACSNSS